MDTLLSLWIALAAVAIASALLGAHGRKRWAPTSDAAALTSLTSILAAFLVIGTIVDCALHKPEWLDPLGLWSSILTALTLTTLGIIAVIARTPAVEDPSRSPR